jgi:hypothetical protein
MTNLAERLRHLASDTIWFDFTRPSLDACICIRCGLVLRPASGVYPNCVYRCCGEMWVPQGRYMQPLPADFWLRWDFGDHVPKKLRRQLDEPQLDQPDEPETDEGEAA